jgi:hypothetical protein
MKQPKPPSFDEVSREFDKGAADADQLRAEQLEHLVVVRNAKASRLKREQDRLTKKLGASDPRVAELSQRRNMNTLLVRDLNFETARARTEIPQVDPKTWVLFGFVRDKDFKGVPNLTVALYDDKGNWIEQLGYACTGQDGSFKLESQNFASLKAPVFIHVLTGQAVRLYVDKVPLTPTGGRLDYRDIILSGDAQPCNPPTPNPREPVSTPGAWIVRGRVSDAEGKGLAGVTVSLSDKDLVFDDRLGQTKTDDKGDYSLTYHVEDFKDLIERKPDIFVKVMDDQGKALFTSKDAIKFEAGRVETVNVSVGKRGSK